MAAFSARRGAIREGFLNHAPGFDSRRGYQEFESETLRSVPIWDVRRELSGRQPAKKAHRVPHPLWSVNPLIKVDPEDD